MPTEWSKGTPHNLLLKAKQDRLERLGQWIKHIQSDNTEEWCKCYFSDREESVISGVEVDVISSKPYLKGIYADFVNLKKYKDYSNASTTGGSMMVVNGVIYKVDSYKLDNKGGVNITLSQDGCCADVDQTFFDEVKFLECQYSCI